MTRGLQVIWCYVRAVRLPQVGEDVRLRLVPGWSHAVLNACPGLAWAWSDIRGGSGFRLWLFLFGMQSLFGAYFYVAYLRILLPAYAAWYTGAFETVSQGTSQPGPQG